MEKSKHFSPRHVHLWKRNGALMKALTPWGDHQHLNDEAELPNTYTSKSRMLSFRKYHRYSASFYWINWVFFHVFFLANIPVSLSAQNPISLFIRLSELSFSVCWIRDYNGILTQCLTFSSVFFAKLPAGASVSCNEWMCHWQRQHCSECTAPIPLGLH